mmetsp:Transcript_7199/g.15617  ORF Transcript_7199/g.15617 Transcript_7199/m.15617 type:complete len:169 (-) Transcript_7199:636-1142(-)
MLFLSRLKNSVVVPFVGRGRPGDRVPNAAPLPASQDRIYPKEKEMKRSDGASVPDVPASARTLAEHHIRRQNGPAVVMMTRVRPRSLARRRRRRGFSSCRAESWEVFGGAVGKLRSAPWRNVAVNAGRGRRGNEAAESDRWRNDVVFFSAPAAAPHRAEGAALATTKK